MLANTGSLELALPTACNSLNPSFKSYYPLKMVTSQLYSSLILNTCFTKYSGIPSTSPLPLASYLEWFLVATNWTSGVIIFSLFRSSILIYWGFYVFRLNLYPLKSKSDAIPWKSFSFSTSSLKITSQDSSILKLAHFLGVKYTYLKFYLYLWMISSLENTFLCFYENSAWLDAYSLVSTNIFNSTASLNCFSSVKNRGNKLEDPIIFRW